MNKLTMLALAGASLIAAATAAAPSLAQEKTLTISWWGFNGDKLDQFVVKPFEAEMRLRDRYSKPATMPTG